MSDRDQPSPTAPFDTSGDAARGNRGGGPDTTADPATPERWLYAGESVTVREPLGAGWLAVTTHRLLVYTPGGDGPTFSGYDRPNVESVRLDAGGDSRYLSVLPRVAIYGLVLLGGGFAFGQAGLTDLLTVDAGDSLAVVGMAGLFDTIRRGIELLELALFGGGLLLSLAALALVGLYMRSRQAQLVVDVAGTGAVTVVLPATVAASDVRLDRVHDALASE